MSSRIGAVASVLTLVTFIAFIAGQALPSNETKGVIGIENKEEKAKAMAADGEGLTVTRMELLEVSRELEQLRSFQQTNANEIAKLQESNAKLQESNTKLQESNTVLHKRIAALETETVGKAARSSTATGGETPDSQGAPRASRHLSAQPGVGHRSGIEFEPANGFDPPLGDNKPRIFGDSAGELYFNSKRSGEVNLKDHIIDKLHRVKKEWIRYTTYGKDGPTANPAINSHFVNGLVSDDGLITSGAVAKLLDRVYSRCGCNPGHSVWHENYADHVSIDWQTDTTAWKDSRPI